MGAAGEELSLPQVMRKEAASERRMPQKQSGVMHARDLDAGDAT